MLPRKYSKLNTVQKGAFGESFARMAFTLEGFEVYESTFDDRGIDFVVRRNTDFYTVQVKATTHSVNPFIYKKKFKEEDKFLFVAVRLIEDKEPSVYVLKGSDWKSPVGCVYYNPEGGEKGPYYELRFSEKYEAQLEALKFENCIHLIE